MEKFDLMKYMTGYYILQTRHGWRIANEIELRPRSDAYKIAATVVSPEGVVAQMSWTITGRTIASENNNRFDLMMIRIK